MWTLFVVIAGVLQLQIPGYTSQDWCERTAMQAERELASPAAPVRAWCHKPPRLPDAK